MVWCIAICALDGWKCKVMETDEIQFTWNNTLRETNGVLTVKNKKIVTFNNSLYRSLSLSLSLCVYRYIDSYLPAQTYPHNVQFSLKVHLENDYQSILFWLHVMHLTQLDLNQSEYRNMLISPCALLKAVFIVFKIRLFQIGSRKKKKKKKKKHSFKRCWHRAEIRHFKELGSLNYR